MASDRAEYDREGCQRNPGNARVVIRAREHQDVWGQLQVLECRECGRRWST